MPQKQLMEQWRDILLELLLAIGHELDVDKQLKQFLPVFLRKLSCQAVAVFEADPVLYQEYNLVKQLPRPAQMQCYGALLGQPGLLDGQVIATDATGQVYAFELTGFGFLCLKHANLSDIFRYEMRQLCLRLSYTLRACRQHQQLQQSQQELDRFFELSDNFMCILTNKGYLAKFNPSFIHKLGYAPDEFYARTFITFVHPADQDFTQAHLVSLFSGRPSAAFTNRLMHKAGYYLDFAWDMSAEITTGLIYASAMDITQQVELQHNLLRAKEAAEQTAQVKAAFLANMSHEIRTPLNGVMGMLDLVLKQQVSESVRQQLGTAIQSGKNLLAIVNDVLDFSKINAGKLQLEQVNFDMTLLLQEVLGSFGYLAQQKNLLLLLDTSALQHDWCLGDPHRIRQIINNLLSNALKFTATGEVRCMVSSQSTEDGIRIVLNVVDTGVGLTASQQETIFQAFTQADASTTRRFGGTGLGLTICKELVELMRGDIQVKSELGKGAEFTVSLLLQPGNPELQEPLIALQHLEATLSGKRVLLVEDNPVNREIAISMLRQLDCHVDSAEHGAAALLLLKNAAELVYDVIVMDCLMPELDGFSATRLIRQGHAGPVWQHIPILALTANAMTEDRQRCLDAGMNDYLSKPYTLEQLQQRLFALFSAPVGAALVNSALPVNTQVAAPAAKDDENHPPQPLWQTDIFQKNFKGLEEIRSEVMNVFRQQLPQAATEIEQAWQQADEKCLTRLAHGLKSSAAQLGCMALSHAAKKLEDSTKSHDGQDVAALVSHLLQLIEQTHQVLPIQLD
jgi:PAS domain S-box-containing protein